MPELKRVLRLFDGLAMIVGIMVGVGIFRTPGLVVATLGRPWITFLAWILGGAIALVGALVFAELATRHPQAGGKYVYAREAFGRRAGFTVGWLEGLVIYPAAIAAIGVVFGEYAGRLAGLPAETARTLGVAAVVTVVGANLLGVATGKWVQNVATTAKVLALGGVVAVAFAAGAGAGWQSSLPDAPAGLPLAAALAVASQPVIWSYYGYPEAAKIAEEVIDPDRTLPRVFLGGIAVVVALYLLLNAAFLHVLPLDAIAASNLVAGDLAAAVFGETGAAVVAVLALLVVLASLNGNVFVTPRVFFGLARDGLAPSGLARVNRGGTPWSAMLLVGGVAVALAATGTFEQLLAFAIVLVLVVDGVAALALFVLRTRRAHAPFRVPLYPVLPAVFVAVYAVLLVGMGAAQPLVIGLGALVVGGAYLAGAVVGRATQGLPQSPRRPQRRC